VKEINSKLKGSVIGDDYKAQKKAETKGGTSNDPPENVKKYFQGVTGEDTRKQLFYKK
jgi:hypothetical protein